MKNYYLDTLLILAFAICLPSVAQAYSGHGRAGGYNNPGLPHMSHVAHGNRYEDRIFYLRKAKRDYQRQLEKYHHELRLKRLQAERRQREEAAKQRAQMLREQRAHEIKMAEVQAKHRATKAQARQSKINYARNANQERSGAVNGHQAQNNGEPANPTVIQRLRYAFTGRY
jgi:hypothetical protein